MVTKKPGADLPTSAPSNGSLCTVEVIARILAAGVALLWGVLYAALGLMCVAGKNYLKSVRDETYPAGQRVYEALGYVAIALCCFAVAAWLRPKRRTR